MRFYRELYLSENLRRKKDRIIKKMERGKFPLRLYALVMPPEGAIPLEYYSTALMRQGIFVEDDMLVVGIASCEDDALYMIEEITDEVYQETGDVDIRTYLLKKQEESVHI